MAVTGRRISPPLFESLEFARPRAQPRAAAACPRLSPRGCATSGSRSVDARAPGAPWSASCCSSRSSPSPRWCSSTWSRSRCRSPVTAARR
ncbi:hypothetical protein [Nocardioides convexus]|uniref:hypothetical protein n=1 Tax=Nocardioides convexus TaxID=2712224 RepID=UPI002418A40A|nr:hypothetical protein [Nocardioides convexus]